MEESYSTGQSPQWAVVRRRRRRRRRRSSSLLMFLTNVQIMFY
jgi:hypothetical protein